MKTSLVAVVQLTSRDDVDHNLARAGDLVRRAVARGATFVALPENTSFVGSDDAKLAAAEVYSLGPVDASSGKVARWASELARETGAWLLVGGIPEVSEVPGHVYNTALVFDATGCVVAMYRKIHLFDVDLPDGTKRYESRSLVPGSAPTVVDCPLGRLGVSICFDVRFPELYRKLVADGATVLSVSAAFTVSTGRDHWHVLLRARAIESQCYVLAPAQWGDHGNGRSSYGHALICDPWGTVIAECPDGEGFAIAELDPERTAAVRRQLPALAWRTL